MGGWGRSCGFRGKRRTLHSSGQARDNAAPGHETVQFQSAFIVAFRLKMYGIQGVGYACVSVIGCSGGGGRAPFLRPGRSNRFKRYADSTTLCPCKEANFEGV